MNRIVFVISLTLISSIAAHFSHFSSRSSIDKKYEATWESLDSRPIPKWYDEAKFGIFMHWGVYSVPAFGTEWMWKYWKDETNYPVKEFVEANYRPGFKYADFASSFTAKFFDAKKWAKIIAKSNAKYFVFTSKHHDGYTNWPSKESWNWNSVDVGPHKDIVGALASAIRKHTDMKFCLYYSLYEWFNPQYLQNKKDHFKSQDFVETKVLPQLFDFVMNYKPEYIWSDGDWETNSTYWRSREFLAWLYNSSPVKDSIVVNDRWGTDANCKHGDVKLCKDRFIPKEVPKFKWENAMTIDEKSWGFRANAPLSDYLTIEELIETLVKTVSLGGNLLMNIAPNMDGVIPPIYEERLEQIGDWLKINGDAIFKTKVWKYQNDPKNPNTWYTSKENAVYAIVLKWPKGSTLQLQHPKISKHTEVTMLSLSKKLKFQALDKDQGVTVSLSDIGFDELPCTWAWVFQLTNLVNRR